MLPQRVFVVVLLFGKPQEKLFENCTEGQALPLIMAASRKEKLFENGTEGQALPLIIAASRKEKSKC
jgi:hypothetical protein